MQKVLMVRNINVIVKEKALMDGFVYSDGDASQLVSKEGWQLCEGRHFTIVHQGKVIAHCALSQGDHFGKKRIRLHQVIVDERYRGKGLGEAIVAKAIDEYEKNQREPLYLVTEDERIPAIRMYKKLGFIGYRDAWKEASKDVSEKIWDTIDEKM